MHDKNYENISIRNANIKSGYENCIDCPPDYCIRISNTSTYCVDGRNFFIMPKCFVGFGGVSFKIYLDAHSKLHYPKTKYKKSLLKSVDYIINNYKKLEFEDCLRLTEIRQKCITYNNNIKRI